MEDVDKWRGASFKQVENHSEAVDALLERVNATTIPVLLRSSNKSLDDLVSELLALEKTARLGGDAISAKRLVVEVIRVYRVQGDYTKMLELLEMLMRKRGQTKQAQSAMIAECAVVLTDAALPQERRREVLERVVHVTESKIHVELEHVRFAIELATLVEAEGQKRAACDLLSGLHVETVTNMPRVEKLDALNRLLRLCLELKDYEHAPLVSRRINYRALARPETREARLTYFALMRRYFDHRRSYFNVARCWYETYLAETNDDAKLAALSSMAVHYLIAEHATAKELDDLAECAAFAPATKFADRSAAIRGITAALQKQLEDISQVQYLLQRFTSIELIRDRVAGDVETLCANHPQLAEYPERQQLLRSRCSEHDLLVISRFYRRLRLVRLAQLVGLTPEHTEEFLMMMVASKTLYAKIDRVDGLVVFEAKKNAPEVINGWNEAVERSVALLDKASHLIVKERMLHNIAKSQAQRAAAS
ncbi:proteasome regulatory non-ATPase subunit 5 [Trypanosoma grayi]|uniref:proteasome regulatory non-ATPase subunit 5 n=1 Tax=Trypanosoma grayi TaxID=71804 RepID=UPI0004F48BEA|nr:proteasome regulatory non-ATPase subunit 5 [Trypanosoma grayi]KEG12790.1 proteasome regulatory non-ATPase subunit 5 [Trypanosoma grayi]